MKLIVINFIKNRYNKINKFFFSVGFTKVGKNFHMLNSFGIYI